MATPSAGTKIVMQVGAELRIRKNGDLILDNPELELEREERAADAVLLYHFEASTGEHVLRLLDPLADQTPKSASPQRLKCDGGQQRVTSRGGR